MIPMGYLYKRVAACPEWLGAAHVKEIHSVSTCVSVAFAEYVDFWKHNGYWLFDSPEIMHDLAAEASVSLDGATLFYYEAHDLQYDEDEVSWSPVKPEPGFDLDVVAPRRKVLEGFDIVSFSLGTRAECSPLSCNQMAVSVAVNERCLLESLEDAIRFVESGELEGCEPGPYRIFAVYSIPA